MARISAAEQAQMDARALELRRAGVPVPRIMAEVGFKAAEAVEEAVVRALKAQGLVVDPVRVRDLELDRLDRLQQAVWLKAVKGDVAAVDRVLKLTELRVRLAGQAEVGTSRMIAAFEATVAALDLQPEDAMAVAAARRIAEKIDAAASGIDQTAETKSLYLIPHLMNLLRELGATPAARAALQASAPVSAVEPGDSEEAPIGLDDFKKRRGGGSA